MPKWKIAIVVVLILLGIVILTNIWAQKTEKIKIGYVFGSSAPYAFFAYEADIFEKEKLDVELIRFEDTNRLIEALISNRIDATAGQGAVTSYLIEEKNPGHFKILGFVDNSEATSIIVLKNSSIANYEELKETRIGSFPGSTTTLVLKSVLEKHGINETEVQIQEIPPGLQLQALESGQITAIYAFEPLVTIGNYRNITRIFEKNPGKFIADPLLFGFLGISNDFIEKHPTDAQKLKIAFKKAKRYYLENKINARKSLLNWTALDNETVQIAPIFPYIPADEMTNEHILAAQNVFDFYYQKGVLGQRIAVETLLFK